MHLGASPSTFRNEFQLRKYQTEAERILWQHLKNRQMEGVKFRRRHPLIKFVGDFYAHQYKFDIELDGGNHQTKIQSFYDLDRDEILSNNKLTILRFTNEEVIHEIEKVLDTIRNCIITLRNKSR